MNIYYIFQLSLHDLQEAYRSIAMMLKSRVWGELTHSIVSPTYVHARNISMSHRIIPVYTNRIRDGP